MTEVASVPGAEDFGDQAAESIARAQQIAALGLPALPDDRAAGYVVIAECAEVAGTTAIVSVLSEDEGLEQGVAAAATGASDPRPPPPGCSPATCPAAPSPGHARRTPASPRHLRPDRTPRRAARPGRPAPAAVLADLLGLHQTTAAKWMHQAGGDWSRYAAELTRSHPHQT